MSKEHILVNITALYKSLYLELTGDDTIELHFEDSSNTLNLDSSFERSQVWGSN